MTLSFFVQYLESKNGLALVKFWLDVETFKSVGGCNDSSSTSERTESRISNYDNITSRKDRNYDCVSISTTTTSNTSNLDEIEEINGDDEIDRVATEFDQSLTDDEKIMKSRKFEDETKTQQPPLAPTIILEDALRIYRKYLVIDSIYSIELPATVLGKLSLALCGSDPESDVEINNLWMAYDEAQKYVFEVLEREHLVEFLDSTFYAKYTVDILTSDSLCLEDILSSESALFYFMEFIEQDKEHCKLPFLEFWLSATNFQKQSSNGDETLKSDALVIYEKWFSLQATSPLNFSNNVRTRVENCICSGEQATCFDIPIKIVEIFLEKNCLHRFIKSQLFFKHLAEVMSKISDQTNEQRIIRRNSSYAQTSTNGSGGNKFKNKHRRTNSDTLKIPQKSISTQNTLLAGLDYNQKRKTDLQIDSRQILEPDLLWRRNNSNVKLSFGRVDQFGRFERDFEMPNSQPHIIPSSKSFQGSIDVDDPQSIFEQAKWSSLKNAMRKLVHLPEDSVQQEIAWQVAEMIIRDVTSITMQQQEGDSASGERSS